MADRLSGDGQEREQLPNCECCSRPVREPLRPHPFVTDYAIAPDVHWVRRDELPVGHPLRKETP